MSIVNGVWSPSGGGEDVGVHEWIGIKPDGTVSELPVVAGRYHLYACRGCPFAHRTLIAHAVLGLDDVISISYMTPIITAEAGYQHDKDPILGKTSLWETYVHHESTYTGRSSVPVLFDKETGRIVNNSSAEIAALLMNFASLGAAPPSDVKIALGTLDDTTQETTLKEWEGHFMTFVRSIYGSSKPERYETCEKNVFEQLDLLNDHLGTSKGFLLGRDVFTRIDLFFAVMLFRLDTVYRPMFRLTRKKIQDYDHIWAFLKAVYALQGVKETVCLQAIRSVYGKSHSFQHLVKSGQTPSEASISFA